MTIAIRVHVQAPTYKCLPARMCVFVSVVVRTDSEDEAEEG